jgi:TfoX/Sxy family transcriptional regulator of competence genes
MFGKTGVFCDGLMLGMVTDHTLYFRVDDHNRTAFKEAESFPSLSYEKKGRTIDLSFWRAPERLFDEPDELVTGREQRWRRRVGSRRKENGQREDENQSLNQREGAMQSRLAQVSRLERLTRGSTAMGRGRPRPVMSSRHRQAVAGQPADGDQPG